MKALFHPTYFPNITTIAAMVKNEVVWEVNDNYQKQTFRNRCIICNDQGKHLLTIPIKHVGGSSGRQRYKDVKIDNSYNWQRQHWRTLQTSYRTSAYFEFYEDELEPLFHEEFDSLLEFNLKTIAFITEALGINLAYLKTESFNLNFNEGLDMRFLVNAKKEFTLSQEPYFQVFDDRNGFVPNSSTLDLLFNEGTNALNYLQNQYLSFLDA